MEEKLSNEFEIEILKQCYESLENTLESVEKEKDYYQVKSFLSSFQRTFSFILATLSTNTK
jgi:hypothetical protein